VELEIAERQIVAKAECILAEPAIGVPSHERVQRGLCPCCDRKFLASRNWHGCSGWTCRPKFRLTVAHDSRGLIRRNDELAASMREKHTEIRTSQKNEG
jgi:hypothetical protein